MPYFLRFPDILQPPLVGYPFFFGLIISHNPPCGIYFCFWSYYIPQPPFVGYFLFFFNFFKCPTTPLVGHFLLFSFFFSIKN